MVTSVILSSEKSTKKLRIWNKTVGLFYIEEWIKDFSLLLFWHNKSEKCKINIAASKKTLKNADQHWKLVITLAKTLTRFLSIYDIQSQEKTSMTLSFLLRWRSKKYFWGRIKIRNDGVFQCLWNSELKWNFPRNMFWIIDARYQQMTKKSQNIMKSSITNDPLL